jgi:hypothetical protein
MDIVRRYLLFTHLHFELSYNANNVIQISVSTDPMRTIDITTGDSLEVSPMPQTQSQPSYDLQSLQQEGRGKQ